MANQEPANDEAALAGVPLIPEDSTPMDEIIVNEVIRDFDAIYLMDLGIKFKAGKLIIFASGSDVAKGNKFKVRKVDLPNVLTFAELQDKANELLAGSGALVDFENKGQLRHPKKPTAMSFNLGQNCFILLRVSEVASNVRFSKQYHAFTRDKDAENLLKWPMRIRDEILQPDGEDSGAGCTAAMFAYHRPTVGDNSLVHERYNIYLDVVDGDVGDAAAPYIPIIVDPDVRYPGGNQGP